MNYSHLLDEMLHDFYSKARGFIEILLIIHNILRRKYIHDIIP